MPSIRLKQFPALLSLLLLPVLCQAQEPRYRVFTPEGFNPEETYPVLICPDDLSDGPGSWCWRGLDDDHGWIRVGTDVHIMEGPDALMPVLDEIAAQYNVEAGRFHIAGFSANSAPVFAVVLAHPDRFSSVTGMPGHPRTERSADLGALQGVHVMLIAGSDDRYWLEEAKRARARLNDFNIEATLEIIPDGGHVLESVFGNGLFERLDALRAHINSEHQ